MQTLEIKGQDVVAALNRSRRSAAAKRGHAARMAKREAAYRAECDTVHAAAAIESAVRAFGNVVHAHAPNSEFCIGTDQNTFPTAELAAGIGTADKRIIDAILSEAVRTGTIRPAGLNTWEVLTEEPLYSGEFQIETRKLAA